MLIRAAAKREGKLMESEIWTPHPIRRRSVAERSDSVEVLLVVVNRTILSDNGISHFLGRYFGRYVDFGATDDGASCRAWLATCCDGRDGTRIAHLVTEAFDGPASPTHLLVHNP